MSDKTIANAIMLQALIATEEILGKNGLEAVLNVAGLGHFIENYPPNDTEPAISFADYARFNQVLGDYIGRASRGILMRIGRVSFRYGLREQGALLGLAGVAIKLMPRMARIKFVLNAIGNALKETSPGTEFWVDSRGGLAYCVRECSICHGRKSPKPVGHLLAGSLAEAAEWATGKKHRVVETKCIAAGDEYGRWEVEI
jgi:predicted hydrocarbon binding protein